MNLDQIDFMNAVTPIADTSEPQASLKDSLPAQKVQPEVVEPKRSAAQKKSSFIPIPNPVVLGLGGVLLWHLISKKKKRITHGRYRLL